MNTLIGRILCGLTLILTTTALVSEATASEGQTLAPPAPIVHQVEFPGDAIPLIRDTGKTPWLLLLSGDPFLQQVPSDLKVRARELVKKGELEDFTKFARYQVPDPVLLPQKTLRSLLENGLIKGASWTLPVPPDAAFPGPQQIRANLSAGDLASDSELSSLVSRDNSSQITIAKNPLHFTSIGNFNPANVHLWVHIDLSYFTPLYDNEIKTPIFPLLGSIVKQISQHQASIIGISISASTDEGDVPLDLRFASAALTSSLKDPSLLNKVPDYWVQQSKIFYLEQFHQVDDILKITKQMIANNPESPLGYYRLYRVQQMNHNADAAEKALLEAIRLDAGYAPELLVLAKEAFERKDISEAIRLQQLATQSLPQPAFAELNLADLYLLDKHPEPARKLLLRLKKLPWSPVYSPDVSAQIDAMLQEADSIIPLYLRP